MSGIFEFSEFTFPEFEDKLTPEKRRRLMGSIGALMLSQRFEVFQSEGAGMDPAWVPLSKKYAKWKLKRFGGRASKILSLTNALRMSFSARAGGQPEGDGSMTITEDEAHLETHVPYAAIQNFGGTIVRGTRTRLIDRKTLPRMNVTIPARPFDQFREQDREEMTELLEAALSG